MEPAVPLQVINDVSAFVDDLSVNDISVECHVEIHTNLEPAHNTAAALPETVINSTPEYRCEARKTVRDTQTQVTQSFIYICNQSLLPKNHCKNEV